MVIRTSQQAATALQGDRAISCPRLGILHLKQLLRRRALLCLDLEAQPQINLNGAGAFAYVNRAIGDGTLEVTGDQMGGGGLTFDIGMSPVSAARKLADAFLSIRFGLALLIVLLVYSGSFA
jgi:hypothetical protein